MSSHNKVKPATGSSSQHTVAASTAATSSTSHKKKTTKPSSSGKQEYVSQVDFSTMDEKILKRYKRTFKLRTKQTRETRDDLVSSVSKHFNQQELNEKDTIAFFIYTLRNQENVYKLPAKVPVN